MKYMKKRHENKVKQREDFKRQNKIQKHLKGFENIPKAIQSPNEVWSLWENKRHQRVVLRNYILFGKRNYIVSTRDGVATDAIAVTNTKTEQYRKGVIL